MMFKYRYCVLMLVVLLGGLSFIPFGNNSCAQTTAGGGIAPQTCDTQVWQTMEMRARMETEREVMQNQNLIFKPDSVLAYTCFDKFAEHAAQFGGALFTHTKYWPPKEIIDWGAPYGMDEAMKNVVLKSMKTYIEGSFKYTMLGDRGGALGGGGDMGIYQTSQVGKDTYACAVMNEVWKNAKCMNFIHNDQFADTDGYYPFADMKGHDGGDNIKGYETIKDTRQFPNALKCSSTTPVYGNTWIQAYQKSLNKDESGTKNKFYPYEEPMTDVFKKVRLKVDPGKCAAPILTGVSVVEAPDSGGETYADGVCTNPGCTFVKSGTKGKCELAGGGSGGGNDVSPTLD